MSNFMGHNMMMGGMGATSIAQAGNARAVSMAGGFGGGSFANATAMAGGHGYGIGGYGGAYANATAMSRTMCMPRPMMRPMMRPQMMCMPPSRFFASPLQMMPQMQMMPQYMPYQPITNNFYNFILPQLLGSSGDCTTTTTTTTTDCDCKDPQPTPCKPEDPKPDPYKKPFSAIFWGPAGTGKTTLARLIAKDINAHFEEISATSSGIKDLRDIIEQCKKRQKIEGIATIIFIDEIHRYSKTQQDALLKDLEIGAFYLIGATTENPSFQINSAILSRVLTYKLQPLSPRDITEILLKGAILLDCNLNKDMAMHIATLSGGDLRYALNILEMTHYSLPKGQTDISLADIQKISQNARIIYDKDGDNHYDHASAYQKSLRGSDADAALYWLGRMLISGEDPRFIARRLLITAAEDVGLADTQALVLANVAFQAAEKLGMPEVRIPLAMVTAYIAKAPKSNATYKAINEIMADISNGASYPVPMHLRDGHYADAKQYGHGQGYIYTHDSPDIPQQFLPDAIRDKKYLKDI